MINEVSCRDKNSKIIEALKGTEHQIFNVGMSDEEGVELTYIHTGLMAAIALNSGAADFVVGGCGTGQGFMISSMQYPGVYCGLITEPLDAWLFSQINAGNCVSLALNKGFGWAGDINLKYIFEKLFLDQMGRGYPEHRRESQKQSREVLGGINELTHKTFADILNGLDKDIKERIFGHKPFKEFLDNYAKIKFVY